MAKGSSSHHDHTHTSAPVANSFEYSDVGVKTATNGPDADWRPSHRETLCLSDCDMKMEGCERSAADCLRQYIFKMCCCGLAHTQMMHAAYAETHAHHVHNGHDGQTAHRAHRAHHDHHGKK